MRDFINNFDKEVKNLIEELGGIKEVSFTKIGMTEMEVDDLIEDQFEDEVNEDGEFTGVYSKKYENFNELVSDIIGSVEAEIYAYVNQEIDNGNKFEIIYEQSSDIQDEKEQFAKFCQLCAKEYGGENNSLVAVHSFDKIWDIHSPLNIRSLCKMDFDCYHDSICQIS